MTVAASVAWATTGFASVAWATIGFASVAWATTGFASVAWATIGFASVARGIGAVSTGRAAKGFGSRGRAAGGLLGLLSAGRGTVSGGAMWGVRVDAGTGPHALVTVGGVGGNGGYETGRGGTEGAARETGLVAAGEIGFASVVLALLFTSEVLETGFGCAPGVEVGTAGPRASGGGATLGDCMTVVGSSSQPSSTADSSVSGFDSATVPAEILLKAYPCARFLHLLNGLFPFSAARSSKIATRGGDHGLKGTLPRSGSRSEKAGRPGRPRHLDALAFGEVYRNELRFPPDQEFERRIVER